MAAQAIFPGILRNASAGPQANVRVGLQKRIRGANLQAGRHARSSPEFPCFRPVEPRLSHYPPRARCPGHEHTILAYFDLPIEQH
jgi:hypothetical protein